MPRMGHALRENRNALAVNAVLTSATGTAEREATLVMLEWHNRSDPITLAQTRPTT